MAEQFYTILTNTGKAKIANAIPTGTKVNLTKLKIGDGNGAYYNPSEAQTDLVHKVYECNVTSVEVDSDNPSWITIISVIPSDVGGFMIREVGVFDDSGNLIAIGKYPETYKPVAADGSTKELYIKMTLEITNASSVELKIDPTVIIATKSDINILTNSIAQIATQLSEIVPNTTLWYLQNVDNIRTRAIITAQGFYDINDDSYGKYRVFAIDGTETWTVITDGTNSFKISSSGDIAPNKTLTTTNKKLRYITRDDKINVKTFGAKGDGITDDTESIQSAINYSNTQVNTKIYFPAGSYLCLHNLTISKRMDEANFSLIGEGKSSYIIYKGNEENFISFVGTNTNVYSDRIIEILVENLYIRQTGDNYLHSTCINIENFGYIIFKNALITGFNIGSYLKNGSELSFHNITLIGNNYGIKIKQEKILATTTEDMANINFYSCNVVGNFICGLYIDSCRQIDCYGGTLGSVPNETGLGVFITDSSTSLTVEQVNFHGVTIDDARTSGIHTIQIGEESAHLIKQINFIECNLFSNTSGVLIKKCDEINFINCNVQNSVYPYIKIDANATGKLIVNTDNISPIQQRFYIDNRQVVNNFPNQYKGFFKTNFDSQFDKSAIAYYLSSPANANADTVNFITGSKSYLFNATTVANSLNYYINLYGAESSIKGGTVMIVDCILKLNNISNITSAKNLIHVVYKDTNNVVTDELLDFNSTDINRSYKIQTFANGFERWIGVIKIPNDKRVMQIYIGNNSDITTSFSVDYLEVWADSFNKSNIDDNNTFYLPSFPAKGTWTKQQRILNSNPTVGQPKSWICTVAGTPGTFVSEGNL